MHMNNDLAKINLNLLVALDALLKEKQVTNAGKRLHITQSAMSNVLKQLREIFNDDLFIRGQASRLIPTAYALSLEPLVAEAIEKLSNVFKEPEVFNPKEAKLTFTLGLSDYTEYLFLPHLIKHIMKEAPGINLIIKHLTYIQNKNNFENDELDLAIGIFRSVPDSLIAQPIYSETMVCMGAIDNPLLQNPINKKSFAEAKHLIVLYTESRAEMFTERLIQEMGYERQVVVSVPNAMPAIRSIIDTDLIAVVFRRIAEQYCPKSKLTYQNFDFEIPKLSASMVWHPKHKNNPAHRWLRELISEIAKSI